MIEYVKRNDLGLTDFEIVMCDGDYKEALKMLLDKIEKAPVADVVEVRHGRWKFDDFDGDGWDYQCSECGGYSKGSYDYCYHCGAKMDRWKMDGGQDK